MTESFIDCPRDAVRRSKHPRIPKEFFFWYCIYKVNGLLNKEEKYRLNYRYLKLL